MKKFEISRFTARRRAAGVAALVSIFLFNALQLQNLFSFASAMRELLSDFPETDLAIAYGSAVFKQAGYSKDEVCLFSHRLFPVQQT